MDLLRGCLFVEREATQEHGIRFLREARGGGGKVRNQQQQQQQQQRARRVFSKGGAFAFVFLS